MCVNVGISLLLPRMLAHPGSSRGKRSHLWVGLLWGEKQESNQSLIKNPKRLT
ncbi:hypothetical protein 2AV2_148 [Nodularia phage vB_NpeS-2AV2]|uniref:Uncharacterized protein n=3 Tax=Ravarandavirus TaxID=2843444 RepID=A0A482MK80_9CAUD|nr:hypothetical protein HWA92_gp148 [Nodularia phage vB_NpeS-2AV2]YP_009844971.1 hypothetical protein HWC13_gp149 [Nodularia phage vB_NspS-kac68v161]ALY07600.1 hypothetical protein 2AV2_148 [Nodularia phage vB_NpeS-2AV2]QBQ73812.1 hypothetical protein kac68v161_gp162 [Nodularia phage vB_NspS-kac68v161]QBQ74008.1 hypothetical protein kac68v162_gp160 [Nodularia phage vB_NspS-kac68v162]